jgi:hypothetical protein
LVCVVFYGKNNATGNTFTHTLKLLGVRDTRLNGHE